MQSSAGEIKIFESSERSFAKIKAEDGEEKVKILLREEINKVFSFYDKTPPEIIYDVVYDMIITEYSNLKKQDIKLCFQRGLSAKYGKTDFFHAGTLTDWIRQYADKRADVADNLEETKASEYKKETWDFSKMPEDVRRGFIDLGKRLDAGRGKPKYNSLEHYLRSNFTGEETEKEKFVQREMEWRIEDWKDDYETPGTTLLDFGAYCDYRAKQELIRINE